MHKLRLCKEISQITNFIITLMREKIRDGLSQEGMICSLDRKHCFRRSLSEYRLCIYNRKMVINLGIIFYEFPLDLSFQSHLHFSHLSFHHRLFHYKHLVC